MKKLLAILILSFLLCEGANAFFKKDIKAYLCNYEEGIFNNPDLGKTGDPCLEGGTSKYKFYIGGKFKAKEEEACNDFIYQYSNTAEMLKKYPIDAWMIGCDSNW